LKEGDVRLAMVNALKSGREGAFQIEFGSGLKLVVLPWGTFLEVFRGNSRTKARRLEDSADAEGEEE
jgi:hypothetical protein